MTEPLPYPDLVNRTAQNALLHLYMQCAQTRRYLPPEKRNQILVRYLKGLLLQPTMKPLKKDLKSLIRVARKKQQIELKLKELVQLSNNFNHAVYRFHAALQQCEEKLQIHSALFQAGCEIKPDYIYLVEEHIEQGFDDQSLQVAPIGLQVNSPRWPEVKALTETQGFFVSVEDSNKEAANLMVHPGRAVLTPHALAAAQSP